MNRPSKKDTPLKRLAAGALSGAFWLAVWALVSRWVGAELLLPNPAQVLKAMAGLVTKDETWRAVGMTIARMLAGFAVGAFGGAVVAVASWKSAAARWIFSPAMKVIRATPVVSFIILIWLWFSSGKVPVVIAALMAAPVVWSAVAQGLDGVDGALVEMGRAYRFSKWKMARLIYLPSMEGEVTAACRTALGLSWKAGVAAEVLCRPKWAMGTEVYGAKLALESAELFGWTILVVGCSFLVEGALGRLLARKGRRKHGA